MKVPARFIPSRSGRHGFTLTDLLAVFGVGALLAFLLLPALAGTKGKSDAVVCLNHLHQLIRAWQMYATDNHDRLVMNFHGNMAADGAAASDPRNAPWASGWLDWTTLPDNTNVLFLINDKYAKLARYTDQDPNLFRCPADRLVSAAQSARGWTRRCRSYSANVGIGAGNAEAGPWDSLYRHLVALTGFVYPGPSETFVFLDEHPCSINDPGFFAPHQSSFVDQPANHHNGAGGFAFADGHLEIHKWQGANASARSLRVDTQRTVLDVPVTAGDPDLHWLSYHTSRVSTNSY